MSSSAYQTIALKKIYRYYGPHILPNKFAFPLFGNLPVLVENPKSFHEEKGTRGSELNSKSIASKIIDWSRDQINT
jgi:hypothetical protein